MHTLVLLGIHVYIHAAGGSGSFIGTLVSMYYILVSCSSNTSSSSSGGGSSSGLW